jgi:succinate dehydrogenase/fumarate reductase flavoprotein subunit
VSGLSLADCIWSGRQAGRAAAAVESAHDIRPLETAAAPLH